MKKIEYALVKRDKKVGCNILSLASFKNELGTPIESMIYLAFGENQYTYMYCCNNESYKCLTSAILTDDYEYRKSSNK